MQGLLPTKDDTFSRRSRNSSAFFFSLSLWREITDGGSPGVNSEGGGSGVIWMME